MHKDTREDDGSGNFLYMYLTGPKAPFCRQTKRRRRSCWSNDHNPWDE